MRRQLHWQAVPESFSCAQRADHNDPDSCARATNAVSNGSSARPHSVNDVYLQFDGALQGLRQGKRVAARFVMIGVQLPNRP